MRRVLVIGIGAGDPDHLTVQAVKALNAVDVFFVIDKGRAKDDLVRLRAEICERHVQDRTYRVVEAPDPERDRGALAYREAVEAWRAKRTDVYEALIRDDLGDDECGAFLVWGDPSVYDSTLAILEDVLARGTVRFDYEVIPGISAVQALAARHRIALNRVGEPFLVTTGRRLRAGFPTDANDVVVMLDADCTFATLPDRDLDIYWGAYLGTDDEIAISGTLHEVKDEIQRVRGVARERKGWIMDTYLLRRAIH